MMDDTLCDLCRRCFVHGPSSFDEETRDQLYARTGFDHHSYTALEESARTCLLCANVFADLKGRLAGAEDGAIGREVAESLATRFRFTRTMQGGFIFHESQPRGSDGRIAPGPMISTQWSWIWADPAHTEKFNGHCGSPSSGIDIWSAVEGRLSRIKTWLADETHTKPSSDAKLPRRLLHLKRSDCGSQISLCVIDTTQLNCSVVRYATLSHCWGDPEHQPLRLLTANRAALEQAIQFDHLPKTFQDSAHVALLLGLEYLWIDSLCIIQDCPNDWAREAALMADIYSSSYVNIAATGSDNPHGGLFFDNPLLRRACLLHPDWASAMGFPRGSILIASQDAFQNRVLNAVLNSRGWVFQERLLSPRTIHFARDQIWWTSNASNTVHMESLPGLLSDYTETKVRVDAMSPLLMLGQAGALWSSFVEAYSVLKLTNPSDRLIALAGVAKAYAKSNGIPDLDYLAGHWRHNLIETLLWRQMPRTGKGPYTGRAKYSAPSWSWASVQGGILFPSPFEYEIPHLIDAGLKNIGDSPWGPVTSGFVVLCGPLWRVLAGYRLTADSKSLMSTFRFTRTDGQYYSHDFIPSYVNEQNTLSRPFEDTKQEASCYLAFFRGSLRGTSWRDGLMLEPTHQNRGEYTRVGCFSVYPDEVLEQELSRNPDSRIDSLEEHEYETYDTERRHFTYRII